MNPLNILYLHSHDTGRYIQPYGQSVPTPHLQQLAEDGVLFRQCFCANPTCSPSRAALLTGSYPHQNGMLGLSHLGFSLNNPKQHLLHTLRKKGYQSVLAGVQHIADPNEDQAAWQVIGYDRYLGDPPEAHTRAVEFLKKQPAHPFFLSVGFFETHREFPAPNENIPAPQYCAPPPNLPDTPEIRLDIARYKASAQILDQKIGQVLQSLEENGLAENTLVICTTDHGIAFPSMKCNLTDSGTGVMLIMRGPHGFSGGQVIDAMTSHLDLFPTLCDLLEIDPPDWLEGRSLLPLIHGEKQQLHEALFAEINYHVEHEPQRSIRTDRWKYIRRFGNQIHPALPNCDDSESKTYWEGKGWADSATDSEMLFDLALDPQEKNNLAAHPNFSATRNTLRQWLNDWMIQTHDPLN